jgi:peptidoglycan hydrolase-like protein with peptidoglycan-binding domain
MQTGVATPKLQLKLFASTAPAYGTDAYNNAVLSQYSILRPGTVGSSVYALQQRLKNLDYPITELTGVFDDQTADCVRLFYASYGLPATDTASVAMQQELYSDTAKHYSKDVQLIVTPPPGEISLDTGIAIPEDGGEVDETTAIALGNSGARVSQIQQRLIALGYMPEGTDTGVFDQDTQEGVNRFLSAIGRTPNGMLTLDMQEFLLSGSAPALGGSIEVVTYEDLAPGDSGDAVLALQRRLGFVQGVRCRLAVQQTVALCLEKQDPQGRDQHSGGVFLQKESQHRRENQNGFFRRNPLSADLGQGLQNQRSTGKQRCRKTGGHPQTAQRRDQP